MSLERLISTRREEVLARCLATLRSRHPGRTDEELLAGLPTLAAIAHFQAYIRERVECGVFRDVEPALAAWAFEGMIWQFAVDAQVFKPVQFPRVDEEEALTAFVELFLRGRRA